MLTDLLKDIRYGLRMLVKSPAFTLAAMLSLALGIAANTSIFTVVNALFLNPLPVHEPDRLVSVFTTDAQNTGRFFNFMQTSYLNYLDYRDGNEVFTGLAAFGFAPLSLQSGGEPEQFFGEIVSGNYFEVLGVKASVGRTFLPEEDATPGAHPVVVLSHGLWKRRFSG